jgi:hypothetical protein
MRKLFEFADSVHMSNRLWSSYRKNNIELSAVQKRMFSKHAMAVSLTVVPILSNMAKSERSTSYDSVKLPPASWGAFFKCIVSSHLRIPPLSLLRGTLRCFYE